MIQLVVSLAALAHTVILVEKTQLHMKRFTTLCVLRGRPASAGCTGAPNVDVHFLNSRFGCVVWFRQSRPPVLSSSAAGPGRPPRETHVPFR